MLPGSPPHVRGKVIDGVQGQSPCRITPACAGKRELDNSELVCLADHPRVCGEKGRGYSSSYPPLGSPPRVRGKGSIKGYALEWAGITPACAGKRPLAPDTAYNTRDHPRVCGEKFSLRRPPPSMGGSPPRVRGKVNFFRTLTGYFRITPACAGKRRSCFLRLFPKWDHPRVCGEKMPCGPCSPLGPGSPPRVRGKDFLTHLKILLVGITPACAGKSRQRQPLNMWVRDHPRVCGEKSSAASSTD